MPVLSVVLFVAALVWLQRLLYHRFWSRKLDMQLRFSAETAFEGEKLALTETLTNAKVLPLPWIMASFQLSRDLIFAGQVNARVSDDYYQNDLFSIGMYQRITRRLEFTCSRRGYYRIKRAGLSSSNLLFSQRLVAEQPCSAKLTVYPRLVEPPLLEPVLRSVQGDIEVRRHMNEDPFAFRGIREYGPGDSFRSINFKATAKTGQLMVNLNSATAWGQVVLLLDLEPGGGWLEEDVQEECIRLAASLARQFLDEGLEVEVLSNGRDIVTGRPLHIRPGSGRGHLFGILEQLARLDVTGNAQALFPQLDELRRTEPAYVIISRYHLGLSEAFGRMKERGMSVRWILPAMAEETVPLPETAIIRWEVKPYDSAASLHQKAAG